MSLFSDCRNQSAPLGLKSDQVRLMEYQPSWPQLYLAEKARLEDILRPHSVEFEHIGSTAVPGLAAKPIIDIMLGHHDNSNVPGISSALENGRYESLGELGLPDRWFFAMGNPRTVHVHLVPYGKTFWNEHILFRDELIRNPGAAKEYLAIKLTLARKHFSDRQSYTDGKAAVIHSILARASQMKDTQ